LITSGVFVLKLLLNLSIMKAKLFSLFLFVCVGFTHAQVTTIEAVLANPCSILSSQNYPTNLDFSLYPNPTSEIVHIQFNESLLESPSIKIYDLVGKIVYDNNNFETFTSQDFSIRVDQLNSGVYLLAVQVNDRITNKKLIINK
jgi:hypothetical protein